MGTFTVALKEELQAALAAAGAVMLDCPISGTPAAMAAGRAVIMRSGPAPAAEKVEAILEVLAPKCPYVGDFGTGLKLKFVLNTLVSAHVVAAAEALLMGVRSGLDAQQVIDVVTPSIASSVQFELRAPLMAARQWQPPTAPARLLHKDMHYILDHAEALGIAAPMARVAAEVFDRLDAAGRGEDEIAAVYEALEQAGPDTGA